MIPISLDEVRQDVVGPLPELQPRRRRVINMVAMAWQRTPSFWRFYSLVATMLTILTILLAVLLSRAYAIKYTHVVDLGYSKYRGFKGSNSVSQWLGMRYAAPPLGSLRFRVAQDPLNTTDIQAVVENRPVCLETNVTTITSANSEDCLFINVFAPTNATAIKLTSKLLPVYIYIQGGGFNKDGNPNYDGTSLIKASDYDIVIVTFNYRVGPYGFLTSKEVQADGDLNIGLKDQRKAFEWVQKYIHHFGGNSSHVTIGGDSAGAASVDLHLTAYGGRDDGLFHAAAAESQSFGPQLNVSQSQYQYDALVNRTGCSNTADTLQCLRALDVSVLQASNIEIPYHNRTAAPLFMYSSVIDGDFIQESTYRLFADRKFLKIPVIYGDVTNEGTIFAPKNTTNYTTMNEFLQNNFPHLTTDQLSRIDEFYPFDNQIFPSSKPYWRTAANAYGEMRYNCPGIFISSAFDNAGVAGNWNYHYNVTDPKDDARGLGVSHTIEITAIWGGYPYVPSGTPTSYKTTNADIIPLMQGYWTSFIRAHNPNTYRLPGSPEWERFSVSDKKRILLQARNGTVMEKVPGDQLERCEYLSGIGPLIQQ